MLHVGQHMGIGVQGDGYGGVPQHSESILGSTFLPSKRVAHVRRRSWSRMAGSPAFSRSEAKDCFLKLLGFKDVPLFVARTKPTPL